VTEQAVTVGAHGGLIGVLSVPDEPAPGARRAVIVSNIGMHHRVGPFRLYVELARELVATGVYVLRFDLSGMGDSVVRSEALTPMQCMLRDLDDAMEWLSTQHDIAEFVLMGLCSGVDSTHAATVNDPRVRAAAFIDGYVYPTPGYYVRHYTVRATQLGRWNRYFKRLARGDRKLAATQPEQTVFARELPTHTQFRSDVAAMTSRGTALLFIYTGGVYHSFNSPRQLHEMLGPIPHRDRISVQTMPTADHVFSSAAQRRCLVQRLVNWVQALPK
jgi:dienelactone hydrolase